jgi:hypothetical protein
MYLIYKHTNIINSKSYIGYTKQTIEKRWQDHLYECHHNDYKICRAIKKYPDQFWYHQVLINNIPSVQEAKNLEVQCIFYYDTFKHGYNSTLGGEGFCGKQPEKSKIKISKIIKSFWKDPKYRKRMSLAHKGNTPWNKGKKIGCPEGTRKNLLKWARKPKTKEAIFKRTKTRAKNRKLKEI